jgi:putative nucleotidyltransferase with HDIG domain
MNDICYRLIFQGFASGTNIKKVAAFFQKELGLTIEEIHLLLASAPRVLGEYETQQRADSAQVSLAKMGCLTLMEPVVQYPDIPFVIAQKHDRKISGELSKALRSRSCICILFVQVSSPASGSIYPSMLGILEDQLSEIYRTSDTVIGIDDDRFIVVGFATDRAGALQMQHKTVRGLKKILGDDVIVSGGYSIFPDEGQTLAKLLYLATYPKDWAENVPPANVPEGAITQVPAAIPILRTDVTWTPLQLCFLRGRGRIFNRLLSLEPQILWFGLAQIPQADQRDFLARLPFDSALVPVLDKLINEQSKPLPAREAEGHFSAIIELMDGESLIAKREIMEGAVVSALNQSDDLPILPAIASQIFSVTSNPNSSGTELADIVIRDPALTSKLLKTVNSAFYGHPQKISSVQYAIILLGTNEIADIAFGLAAARVFDSKYLQKGIDPQSLWHHSLCTAMIVKHLYRMLPVQGSEGVFSAGLLHDVGKIFFVDHFNDAYRNIYQEAVKQGQAPFELEEDIFGMDHAMVGRSLAIRWNLPEILVQAIGYHHQPFCAPSYSDLAAVTGLADYLYYRSLEASGNIAGEHAVQHRITYGHWLLLSRLFGNLDGARLEDMANDARAIIEENHASLADLS